MRQEIIVKANAHEDLKPLVASAIRNQIKILEQDIASSQARITALEIRMGMTSSEFERKLAKHEIEESLDTFDWTMELASLRLLQGKYKSLCEAEIS
ncbi:MAG: hypothetical protein J0M11_21620 [Anaerolineae bacterium]|jgi:hypothetical protein|nr:hypothetical protein [Anaerolineae bacterium]